MLYRCEVLFLCIVFILGMCPTELDIPENGMANSTGYFPGDSVTYTCKPGYGIFGNKQRNCTILGYWNRAAPLCKRMYNYNYV